jgi:hypothetical protein
MRLTIKSAMIFALVYIACMIPTYILPYFGSNSIMMNGFMAATHHVSPALLLHLGFMLALVAIGWGRGAALDKRWLVIFPILATLFDLVPTLSVIPLVPTTMHLLLLILGVSSKKQDMQNQCLSAQVPY